MTLNIMGFFFSKKNKEIKILLMSRPAASGAVLSVSPVSLDEVDEMMAVV